MSDKVVILGLDGVNWDFLLPFVRTGELPALRRLLNTGRAGVLESVVPTISPSSWASFSTGVFPEKHGVFEFMTFDDNSRNRPVCSRDVKAPAIHEMLSHFDMRCIIVNLPMTYPPAPVNGIIVADSLLSPKKYIYPPDRAGLIDEYEIEFTFSGSTASFFDTVMGAEEKRLNVALRLFENEQWDLFFAMVSATDWICHRYYGEILDGKVKYFQRTLALLKRFDGFLGRIQECIDAQTYLFVISDHGFKVAREIFYVNNWLRKMGLLRVNREGSSQDFDEFIYTARGQKTPIQLGMPDRVGNIIFGNRFLRTVTRKLGSILNVRGRNFSPELPRCKAFSGFHDIHSFGIHINFVENFRCGPIRDRSEYEQILNDLLFRMGELRLESLDGKVFRDVVDSSSIEGAPDILFCPEEEVTVCGLMPQGGVISAKCRENVHHPDGIFLVGGRDIEPGFRPEERISICDIMPTAFHLLGLPRAGNWDGRVVGEFFSNPPRDFEFMTDEDYEKISGRS